MQYGGDPYGNYAYKERIVKENRQHILNASRNAAMGLWPSPPAPPPLAVDESNPLSPNRANGASLSMLNLNYGAPEAAISAAAESAPRSPTRTSGPLGNGRVPVLNSIALHTLTGELSRTDNRPFSSSYGRSPMRVSSRGIGTFSPNYGYDSSRAHSPTAAAEAVGVVGTPAPGDNEPAPSEAFRLPPPSPSTNARAATKAKQEANASSVAAIAASPTSTVRGAYRVTLGGVLGGGTYIRSASASAAASPVRRAPARPSALPALGTHGFVSPMRVYNNIY